MADLTQRQMAEEAARRGWITRQQLETALAEGPDTGLLVRMTERGWITLDQIGELFAASGFEELQPLPTEDSIDRTFGHFVLNEELSHGASAVVFKAWDVTHRRFVALKRMRGHSREEILRFIREAQAYSRLRHRNIARVYESGEVEGEAFLSMELIDGIPISGDLPLPGLLAYLRDAALAVHYAHRQGVIHRDLKPDNILIDKSGRIVVTDFGLAKLASVDTRMLSSRVMAGTPGFMSPEQVRGDKVTPAVDVYGLGATLYGLVTGRPPHRANSMAELIQSVLKKDPEPARKWNPNLPPALEKFLIRALSRDPAKRPSTAEEFAHELDKIGNRQ